MQIHERESNIYGLAHSKCLLTTLLVVIISSILFFNPWSMAFAQQQQDAGSLVNSICQQVRDNSLIAGLVGLDQALNICNNINAIGSNQALTELCSIIGGLNIINIDSLCDQKITNQSQSLNENNGTANNQVVTQPSQSNTENPSSNSIIDRILGLLFGFLKF
jgi:hypothetical protein